MTYSRRRFLTLASAAVLAAPSASAFRWQGVALGAQAQIILDHPRAEDITRRARAEIDRLETIFSLYRADSDLARLNAAGRLTAPSFELLECLSTARTAHKVTEGRFDPTVQPLWQVLAEAHSVARAPDAGAVAAARRAIGFDRVAFDTAAVAMDTGQRLTLNGIAQGYIADCVADLMRGEGIEDVLIDTGEIVAIGSARDRDAWPVRIAGEATLRDLTGRALATSAPLGTVLDREGRIGHILDARTGKAVTPDIRQLSISATRAAMADALSTGLCLARDEVEVRRLLRNVKDARLESIQTATEKS